MPRSRLRLDINKLLIIFMILALSILGGFAVKGFIQSDPTTGSDTVASNEPRPDEIKPSASAIDNHSVAADDPELLVINKIQLKARIKGVGLTASGAVAAPTNIFDVGWFKNSGKPGQPGAMLIDGHVRGPTQNGSFYDLQQLSVDGIVTVVRGDGAESVFKVMKTENTDKDDVDMARALQPLVPNKRGLNLITCSGGYDKTAQTYENRLIVYTLEI